MTHPTDDELEAMAARLSATLMPNKVSPQDQAIIHNLIDAAAMLRACKGRGTPVAWRWHWNGGCEPDVWVYCEYEVVSDRHRTAEPLYTTLSAPDHSDWNAAIDAAKDTIKAMRGPIDVPRTSKAVVFDDACESCIDVILTLKKGRTHD